MLNDPLDNRGSGISALLVCFNERAHLVECIKSLSFCDEIVVVDLGSSDGSAEAAEESGARVVPHEWVPNVPMVRPFGLSHLKNDWVVALDPDMRFPTEALPSLMGLLARPDIAIVGFPYQNLFRGRRLKYGRWGGIKRHFPAVVNRQRVTVVEHDHRGHFRAKDNFIYHEIGTEASYVIPHYWVDTLSELKAKLERYVPDEIQARLSEGHESTWIGSLSRPAWLFLKSLLVRRGLLDGPRGFGLAALLAWYEWKIWFGLRTVSNSDAR